MHTSTRVLNLVPTVEGGADAITDQFRHLPVAKSPLAKPQSRHFNVQRNDPTPKANNHQMAIPS